MKHITIVFVVIFSTLLCQAEFASLVNYRDPKDGHSLSGWSGSLNQLKRDLDPNKNYALVVLHQPVNAFLMKDVFLFRSTVLASINALINSPNPVLGHMQVGWACNIPGYGRMEGLTGQSGEFSNQGKEMLLESGYGMSLFFANFTDGVLQSANVSARRINNTHPSNFTWMAFEISQNHCVQGLRYINRYIQAGAYRNFSFTRNPRNYEGGGCTSFASTALMYFGVFSESLVGAMQTDFQIPRSFIGNPRHQSLPPNTTLPNWLNEDFYQNNEVALEMMAIVPFAGALSGHRVAKVFNTEVIQYSLKTMIDRVYSANQNRLDSSVRIPARRAYGLAPTGTNGYPQSSQAANYITIDRTQHHLPIYGRVYNYVNQPNISVPRASMSSVGGKPGVVVHGAPW